MPDSTPNYLTIGSNGLVTANFSGGVTVPLGTGPLPTLNNGFRWLKNLVLRAAIVAYEIAGPQTNMALTVTDAAAPTARSATISLNVASNIDVSSVNVVANDSTRNSGVRKLIASDGTSDYVLGHGQTSVVFTASQSSAVQTFNHNLGYTPQVVVACASQGSPAPVFIIVGGKSSTQVQIQGIAPLLPLNGNVQVDWMAW